MLKKLIVLAVFVVLGGLTLSQAVMVNAANFGGGPGPITSPITYFQLSGRVAYTVDGWYKPAVGATVAALNLSNNVLTTTKTNSYGAYTLTLQAGTYKVKAFDSQGSQFTPKNRIIELSQDIKNVFFTASKTQ